MLLLPRRLILAAHCLFAIAAYGGTVNLTVDSSGVQALYSLSAGFPEPFPPPQGTILITPTGSGQTNYTVAASSQGNFLTVSKDGVHFSSSVSGTIAAGDSALTITVQIANGTLHAKFNPGYSGQVTITGNNLVTTPAAVSTSLNVTGVDLTGPDSAPLVGVVKGVTSSSSFTIKAAAATADVESNQTWLTITSNLPFTITGSRDVQFKINPTNLSVGVHSAIVAITYLSGSPFQEVDVTVSAIVQASGVLTNTTSLTFSANQGASSPPSQNISVTSNNGSTLGLTISASTANGGGWLTFTQSANTTPATIVVSPVLGSLSPGTYTGSIQIDPGGGSPTFTVAVTFTVSGGSAQQLTLPHVAAGSIWTTGLWVVNNGGQAANFSISFFDANGSPMILPFTSGATATLSGVLPAYGSAYYEASNSTVTNVLQGSGRITSDASISVQALFREQVGSLYYEAVVPPIAPSKEFVTPFDATTFTATGDQLYLGLAIANADQTSASVSCIARDTAGNVIPNAVNVPNLPPSGHWADYQFSALLGKQGTVDCTSTANIAALAERFIGINAFSSLPVVSNPSSSSPGAGSLTLPHVAAGSIWTTGLWVVNTGSQPASFSISFFDPNGNPMTLPFASGATDTLGGVIPANGSAYYEASRAAINSVLQGSGRITSDASISVQALFREQVGSLYYEAAVPPIGPSKEFVTPFDATPFTATGDQLYLGLAIANADQTSASVTCIARDTSGNVIPNAITVPTLPPSGHWADYQFNALLGKQGTVDCTSTANIAALAERFIGINAFSSLPVITH